MGPKSGGKQAEAATARATGKSARRRHVADLVVAHPLAGEGPRHAVRHVGGEEQELRPLGQGGQAQRRQLLLVARGQGLDGGLASARGSTGRSRFRNGPGAHVAAGERAQRRRHLPVPRFRRDRRAHRWRQARERRGQPGGGDAASRDRRHGAEVVAGEDAQLVHPPERAEVEQRGAEPAAGQAQADAGAAAARNGVAGRLHRRPARGRWPAAGRTRGRPPSRPAARRSRSWCRSSGLLMMQCCEPGAV